MPYDKARDLMRGKLTGLDAPARRLATVTPSDAADLSVYARALYIGGSGDVRIIPVGNDDASPVTLKSHNVGYVPIQVRRVLATGTTATNILALS